MIEEFTENFDENIFQLYKDTYNYHLENDKDNFVHRSDDILKEKLMEAMSPLNVKTFVYKGEQILGYIMLGIDNSRLFISQLAVNKDYQNKHIGTKLVKKALDFAKENNLEMVELNCFNFNTDAKKLYEYLGFKPERIIYQMKIKI